MGESKQKKPTFLNELLNGKDGLYQTGISVVGEKKTPKWLKSSCLGILAIPIIGGDGQ